MAVASRHENKYQYLAHPHFPKKKKGSHAATAQHVSRVLLFRRQRVLLCLLRHLRRCIVGRLWRSKNKKRIPEQEKNQFLFFWRHVTGRMLLWPVNKNIQRLGVISSYTVKSVNKYFLKGPLTPQNSITTKHARAQKRSVPGTKYIYMGKAYKHKV